MLGHLYLLPITDIRPSDTPFSRGRCQQRQSWMYCNTVHHRALHRELGHQRPTALQPTTNGQGPSRPHWQPLAAVGEGFLPKTHERVGAMMTPNIYGHSKKNSLATIETVGAWLQLEHLHPPGLTRCVDVSPCGTRHRGVWSEK